MDPLSSNAPTRFSYGVPSERRNPRVLSTRNSLQGLFETIGTYGPQIAIALAVRNHDALGTFAATTISNIPRAGSTTGERTITPNTNAETIRHQLRWIRRHNPCRYARRRHQSTRLR